MKSTLLFPPVFRVIGVILLLPGLVLGYIFVFPDVVISFLDCGAGNLTDELATTLIVSGLIFIGFSRLKDENNDTINVRLNALYWSVLATGLFLAGYWTIHFVIDKLKLPVPWPYFDVVTYNLFILLVIFIARLYYTLNKIKKGQQNKPLYFLPNIPFSLIGKIVCTLFFVLVVTDWAFPSLDQLLKKLIPDDTVVVIPFCVLILIWSKEKNEIEYVKNIRLKSMQLAIYINYSLFLIATWLVYGVDYWIVLCFGLIGIPIFFLVVFYYELYILRKKHKTVITNL